MDNNNADYMAGAECCRFELVRVTIDFSCDCLHTFVDLFSSAIHFLGKELVFTRTRVAIEIVERKSVRREPYKKSLNLVVAVRTTSRKLRVLGPTSAVCRTCAVKLFDNGNLKAFRASD